MWEKWYNCTTGIEILDIFLKVYLKYGYVHHIIRLMVICNIMNMCEINPKYIHKWFMEMW